MENEIKRIANDIANIVISKNNDYGNSFEKQFDKYGWVTYFFRVGDKISRLEQLTINNKNPEIKEETVNDTLMDIVGYSLLMLSILKKEEE